MISLMEKIVDRLLEETQKTWLASNDTLHINVEDGISQK